MFNSSAKHSKPNIIYNNLYFISQNVQSLRSEAQSINLDERIEIMTKNNILVYCIQETSLDGGFVKEINCHTMFHHGLESQACSRGQKVVGIILSPEFLKFYKFSESKPLLTLNSALNEEYGRFIGSKLSLEVKQDLKEFPPKIKRRINPRQSTFSSPQFIIL